MDRSDNLFFLGGTPFISEEVFFKVIAPLLTVRDSAVLKISSPDDEIDYYSKLFEDEVKAADCSSAAPKAPSRKNVHIARSRL